MTEQRRHYRKHIHLLSYLVKDGEEIPFYLQDLSLSGIRALFDHHPHLIVGSEVHIRMPDLKLAGDVRVMRCRPAEEEGYDVGFDFAALDGLDDNAYQFRKDEPED